MCNTTDMDTVLAQLRHLYTHLNEGRVRDQPQIANGLLAPQIEKLERLQAIDDDLTEENYNLRRRIDLLNEEATLLREELSYWRNKS